MKNEEHKIQVAYFEDLRIHNPQAFNAAFAIPNGGHRHPAVGAKLKAEGVKAGIPDIMLPIPSQGLHGLFLEVKTQKGRLSDHQKQRIKLLEDFGYGVNVCFGLEALIDATNDYLWG